MTENADESLTPGYELLRCEDDGVLRWVAGWMNG
jgi:hypothetical protein